MSSKQDPNKIRNIAIIAHEYSMRHPQAGFSSRRQKGVTFCRAALPLAGGTV